MTGNDLKRLRLSILVPRVKKNGDRCLTPLTQPALAAALGVSTKTVQNWEARGEIKPMTARIIEETINGLKPE